MNRRTSSRFYVADDFNAICSFETDKIKLIAYIPLSSYFDLVYLEIHSDGQFVMEMR